MSEVAQVPQLRFPEFSGEWETVNVKHIIKDKKGAMKIGPFGSQLKKDTFVKDGYKVYGQENIFIKDFTFGNRYITEEHFYNLKTNELHSGDFVISTMGTIGKSTIVPENIKRGIMDSHMIRLQLDETIISSSFLGQLFDSFRTLKQAKRLSVGGIMDGLSIGIVKEIMFTVSPSLPEQQKIAAFLTVVDTKIRHLSKKQELLGEYKKGLMQQIFSQAIRFKADDGSKFPEWEEKRLGDILDYEQPTNYIVDSTEYDNSFEMPVLTAGKSFVLGYTNETHKVFENIPVIIFDDFTTANKYVDFPFKVKSSAMKILKPKDGFVNIRLIFEFIQMLNFPIGEHKRHWISEYQDLKIPFPSFEEQAKIASFLSSIDIKIEQVGKQLDKSKQFKKALLQQMFV
jgi:type I restriction enzyme S subunit